MFNLIASLALFFFFSCSSSVVLSSFRNYFFFFSFSFLCCFGLDPNLPILIVFVNGAQRRDGWKYQRAPRQWTALCMWTSHTTTFLCSGLQLSCPVPHSQSILFAMHTDTQKKKMFVVSTHGVFCHCIKRHNNDHVSFAPTGTMHSANGRHHLAEAKTISSQTFIFIDDDNSHT